MIIDGYSAEDINNNAMKSMNQYILKRNSELIDRKVIEDIKAEIEHLKDIEYYNYPINAIIYSRVLDIINKHIGDTE